MSVVTAQLTILGGCFLAIFILLVGVVVYAGRFTGAITSLTTTLETSFIAVFDSFVSLSQFLAHSLEQYAAYLVQSFTSFIGQVGQNLTSLANYTKTTLNGQIQQTANQVITVSASVANSIINGFFTFLNGAAQGVNGIVSMFTSVATLLNDLYTRIATFIFSFFAQVISQDFALITSFVTTIITVAATGINDAIALIDTAISGAREVFDDVVVFFNAAASETETLLNDAKTQILSAICTIVIGVNQVILEVCCGLGLSSGSCSFARNCHGCSPYCGACTGVIPGVTCAGPCNNCGCSHCC